MEEADKTGESERGGGGVSAGEAAFEGFPKMPRLSREIIITEKIDGTNAQILIAPLPHVSEGEVPTHAGEISYFYGADGSAWGIWAGSRTRWISPVDDNFGFAAWVAEHYQEIRELGPGRHFGEWFGAKIQRGYGLTEKRFALFNVSRWEDERPACCSVVPVLYRGQFSEAAISAALDDLRQNGSRIAPGFMRPEGVVVWHVAANMGFKKTLEKDEQPKGLTA